MSISYLFWKCYFFLFYINRTGYFRTWSTKYFLWLTLILTLFGLSHNFSVTLRIAEYVFYVYDVPLDIEETEFERRFSISQYKYRGSFSNMSSMKMCLSRYFWCNEFVKSNEFSVNVTKVTFRIRVSNTLLCYLIVFQLSEKDIVLKVCKLDNSELHNALQVSLIDLRKYHVFILSFLLWIFPWIKFSWYACLMGDKLERQLFLVISPWSVIFL